MKKILSLILVSSLIFFASCSKSNEEMIVGKWRFADIDISELSQGKELSEAEKGQIEEMKVMLRKVTMEYQADKTFVAELPAEMQQGSKKGKYSLEEEGKFIVTEQDGRKERSEIKKLTGDSLILKSEKGGTAFFVREPGK